MCRPISLFLVLALACSTAFSQDVKVHGYFLSDTIAIGKPTPYSLTVHYPAALNVIFPDSAWKYAPYEFDSKKYFRTVTKNDVSRDSVVYFLTTYEVDSIQTLTLPVFVVHQSDCTRVDSNRDTIALLQLVRQKLDSVDAKALPLKVNTDYFDVSWLLNYPLLLIMGGILIVVLGVVWAVFGKRILRHYKLKRMMKAHADFLTKYAASVEELSQNFSQSNAESAFVLWKKYMEKLVSRPYTRYTAREILRMDQDEHLRQALNGINRIIYAGVNSSTEESFAMLRSYTEQQFVRKTQEVKNG